MTLSTSPSASATALAFIEVSKKYAGRAALDRLSFSIPAGATCAFIGANGAGKTTSFSIVGGFLRGYSGRILLRHPAGGEFSLRAYRGAGGVIGLMPQDVQCFEDRSIFSQLTLFARLAGRSSREANIEVGSLLEATDLAEHQQKTPAELSHGMRARFGIAQAFVGEPGLVLLDEPTAGLDPLHLAQIRELLARFRGKTTLVVSSHDLSELQGWCDYVVMIERGRCLKHGPLEELVESGLPETRWVVRGKFDLTELQRDFPGLTIRATAHGVDLTGEVSAQRLVDLISWFDSRRCEVICFDRRPSLERAYLSEVTS